MQQQKQLLRSITRRERRAFEAGWIASAERMGDALNGQWRPQHRNVVDAWKHYKETVSGS